MEPEPDGADRSTPRRRIGSATVSDRDRTAGRELVVGAVLVVLVAVGGLYFWLRPSPTFVDGWLTFLPGLAKGTWFTRITVLRSPAVVVVGSAAVAALCVRRDRPRACACLLGPILALLTCELVAKPLVGRKLGGMFSYPSGSVVGAAALATVAVLAAPRRWRPAVGALAGVYVVWMALAVVAMQWHLPTDAIAGVLYGIGVVLVVDGAAGKLASALGRRRRAVIPSSPGRSAAPG
jgi:membrane-associated phospholipid phosphatase